MSEDSGFWGEPGSELKLGGDEDNDGRGLANDSWDVVKDVGEDLAWTGESMYDTTGSMVSSLKDDTVNAAESFGHDIAGGHVIMAGEDLVGGLWNDGVDLVEGVGMDAGEALLGVGAGALSVFNNVVDVGGDVVDDVEDVAEDIGEGIEDLAGDIADLF